MWRKVIVAGQEYTSMYTSIMPGVLARSLAVVTEA
jgi:hypothetical protein